MTDTDTNVMPIRRLDDSAVRGCQGRVEHTPDPPRAVGGPQPLDSAAPASMRP